MNKKLLKTTLALVLVATLLPVVPMTANAKTQIELDSSKVVNYVDEFGDNVVDFTEDYHAHLLSLMEGGGYLGGYGVDWERNLIYFFDTYEEAQEWREALWAALYGSDCSESSATQSDLEYSQKMEQIIRARQIEQAIAVSPLEPVQIPGLVEGEQAAVTVARVASFEGAETAIAEMRAIERQVTTNPAILNSYVKGKTVVSVPCFGEATLRVWRGQDISSGVDITVRAEKLRAGDEILVFALDEKGSWSQIEAEATNRGFTANYNRGTSIVWFKIVTE